MHCLLEKVDFQLDLARIFRVPPFSQGFVVFSKDPRRPPSCATWCAAEHLGIFDVLNWRFNRNLRKGPEMPIVLGGFVWFCMVFVTWIL